MDKIFKKLNNSENLMLHLGLIVLILKVSLSFSKIIPYCDLADTILSGVGALLLLLSILSRKYTLKNYLIYAAVIAVTFFISVKIGNLSLLLTAITCLAIVNRDFDSVIRTVFVFESLFLIINTLLALINTVIFKNPMQTEVSGVMQYNFGFGHPNTFSIYLFNILIMYLWLKRKHLKLINLISVVIIDAVTYVFTDTKTSLVLIVLICVLLWIPKTKNFKKAIRIIASFSIPFYSLFIFVMECMYKSGNIIVKAVDKLLSTRIKLGAYALEQFGITWFGRKITNYTVTYSTFWKLNSFTFDNVYSYFIYNIGIVWLIALCILFYKLAQMKKTNMNIFLIIWTLYGICEIHGMNCFLCFPIMFSAMLINKIIGEQNQRLNQVSAVENAQKEPVRILQIGLSKTYYGTESVIMNLYRNIDRSRFQFDFLVDHTMGKLEYEDEITDMGGRVLRQYYRIHEVNNPNYISPNNFFKNHPEIRGVHYNLNNYTPHFRYLVAAKKSNLPIRILHSHNAGNLTKLKPKDKVYNTYAKLMSGFYANVLLACSDLAGKWNFGNYSFKPYNNAVDTSLFKFDKTKRDETRSKYDLNGKFVMGFVGRFQYQKNPEFLLEIYEKVKERRSNAALVLIGEGNLKEKMQSIIKTHNLTDVFFIGKTDNVNDWYQALDVLLLPSRFEGFPVVLIEAQCSGLQCIVSDNITKEAKITDRISFLPINNSELWANSLSALPIDYQRNDYCNIVKEKGFDLSSNAEIMTNIYSNLLSGKKRILNSGRVKLCQKK